MVIILTFPALYITLREEGHSREYSNAFAAFVALLVGIHFTLNSTLSHLLDVFLDRNDKLRLIQTLIKIGIATVLTVISYRYFGANGIFILILPVAFMVYVMLERLISKWWKKLS